MSKTIIHALIACALGVALGLLSDSARAANVGGFEDPYSAEAVEIMLAKRRVCMAAGTQSFICELMYPFSERGALKDAEETLTFCARPSNRSYPAVMICDEARAYIKQRWGTP